MEKGIVILDANKKNCRELCAMLDEQNYNIVPKHSLNDLSKFIDDISCQLLILDLDSISVDKNLFRKLKKNNPKLYIVGLSSRPFHPELEEAMSHHIYACLSKPVDEEELVYWIKSLI
jgi:DNA-binding NtrC family response regulator